MAETLNLVNPEDKLSTIVGTWQLVGTRGYSVPQSNINSPPFVCAQTSMFLKINADHTFQTYNSLRQKLFEGTIKGNNNETFEIQIKNGHKKGKYWAYEIYYVNYPYCSANQTDIVIDFRVDFDQSSYAPEKNLFFDGSYSKDEHHEFKKL